MIMAPKNKGKKGKKQPGDWDDSDDDLKGKGIALGMEDTPAAVDEEEDFGGLMVSTSHFSTSTRTH